MAYTRQSWTNGPAGGTALSAARLSHIEDGIFAAGAAASTPLAGDGIDPTGATDSTLAVQAILTAAADGTTVVVPAGSTLRLTATLNITHRIRLTGSGTLNWVSGINNGPALSVTADGTHIDGVRMTSYTVTTTTGSQSYAVLIEANDCAVEHCTISNFQHGVAVRANGEWLRTRITDNHILDITGAGGGPSDVGSLGEDRGDGITCWGAIATITGNVVTAKAGADARVGIHAEGLPTFEVTPSALSGRMVTISGNTVTGKFRRGITLEDISNSAITGNTVSDSTWWGISVVSNSSPKADGNTVTGNTVYWTRLASDNQGSAYSPFRVGIMLYDDVRECVLSGNTIVIAATGVAAAAITTTPAGGSTAAVAASITANTVLVSAGGSCPIGFNLPNTTQATVVGNVINCTPGTTDAGIRLPSSSQSVVSSNQIIGSTSTGIGISQDSTGSGVFANNLISGFATGIAALNSASGIAVTGNAINCPTAIDTNGVTGSSSVTGNQFGSSVTTGFANRSNAVGYTRTAHIGAVTPTGGSSGNILIASGKIWANDAGAWKSVAIV